MVLVVESILEFSNALHCSIHLLIPTKHQKDRTGLSELLGKGPRIDHINGFGILLSILPAE